jgi:hypothetical protein
LMMHANIPRAKKSIAGTRRLEIDIVIPSYNKINCLDSPIFPICRIASGAP